MVYLKSSRICNIKGHIIASLKLASYYNGIYSWMTSRPPVDLQQTEAPKRIS